MKKLFAISLICWSILHCSIQHRRIISPVSMSRSETGAYWLYIGMDDRVAGKPEDAVGRHKKGDLISVVSVFKNVPSTKVQGVYAIIKVDSISIADIVEYTSSWEDTVIAGNDTITTTKAYRRWRFNVNALGLVRGIDTTRTSFGLIKANASRKTPDVLLGYERKCKIEKYVNIPIKKFFDWAIPKAYATEQITTCNLPGETYANIVIWESTEDGTMNTGDPDVLECYDDDGILANSTRINIDGWTNNDATTQIIVRVATGEQHTGTDSTGFTRQNSASAGTGSIIVQEDFTIIDGIDWDGTGVGSTTITLNNGLGLIVRNNIVRNSDLIGIRVAENVDDNFDIFNNIIYDSDAQGISIQSNQIGRIYNNTVYNNGSHGIRADYDTGADSSLFSNNASFDNSSAEFQDTLKMRVGSTNNASSDGTADDNALLEGIVDLTDTDQFTAPAQPNRDFSVLDTGADIYNAGTDLSGTVDDDAIGTLRPQSTAHDIGAFEFIVADVSTPATKKAVRPRWWN